MANSYMSSSSTRELNFKVIDGERIYVGPERRKERRREHRNERIETLLRNFGLDRRLRVERRRKDTSWLVTSQKVVNL
ncbi:MAG: hypothetical protein OQJ89_14400 [Kangiellaceae bacterium]|nr:hypothetical protein [Kangiellaceae bacterium]MCW9018157.1 hypothetical protein [Kangiellaceae bacterium]